MKNVYQAATQFVDAQKLASKQAREQKQYKSEWMARKLGMALTSLRERIRKPELWAPAELIKLCTLLGDEAIGGTEVQ